MIDSVSEDSLEPGPPLKIDTVEFQKSQIYGENRCHNALQFANFNRPLVLTVDTEQTP